MAMKLFLPPGASVVSEDVVKLSDGTLMPKWAFVAVPIEVEPRVARRKSSRAAASTFVDAVTGAVASQRRTPVSDSSPGDSYAGQYDFSEFSRTIDAAKFLTAVENALPALIDDSLAGETDPGYFEAVPAAPRLVTTVTVSNTDFSSPGEYTLGERFLSDVLVKNRAPQNLADQVARTKTQIVTALKHVSVNIIDRVNTTNEFIEALRDAGKLGFSERTLPFIIHTGFVQRDLFAPNPAFYRGEAIRLEFQGTPAQVYQKAVDMALKLPFDELYLDYRSITGPLISVVAVAGSQRKKIFTRFDDVLVSSGKLLNLVRNVDLTDLQETRPAIGETDAEILFDPGDDYSGIGRMIRENPAMFGGTVNAMNILTQLGFGANPFLSNLAGKAPGAGGVSAVSQVALSALGSAIQCPDVKKDPKLFPTSSHPHLRQMTDVSQLDDSSTQDNQQFPLRANNPLRVRKVAGVTDLVTRFGYLGESGGIAIFRDHVGGAAAGLNYLMQTGAGGTMGAATKSVLGNLMGAQNAGAGSAGDDLTAITPSKIFQNMSQHLFGVSDPSGVMQECATISSDSMDSLISYAGALSKSVSALETSPLTHDEWASAYQIAKNESNGHVTRSTTGVDLPVTEETGTANTGVMTPAQAKETRFTGDYEKRGQSEAWNPLSNFTHYSTNAWGSDGSNWIAQGLIDYEQKTSNTDTTKIAKKYETEELDQDPKHPTGYTTLDWTKTV